MRFYQNNRCQKKVQKQDESENGYLAKVKKD